MRKEVLLHLFPALLGNPLSIEPKTTLVYPGEVFLDSRCAGLASRSPDA